MTEGLKVSVIVPTYNRAEYLPATLDTLIRQTLREPYEVIVVDDGSTDDTRDGVAPYVCGPTRGLESRASAHCVVRYERIPHAGLPAPINRGLELAHGEYVFLANDHDLYAPETLAALSEALDGHSSAVLAVSDVALVSSDASREVAIYSFPYCGFVAGRRFLVEQLLPGIGSIAPHNMFRREALGCERLDVSYGWAADPELWLRLASRGDVVHVAKTLVRARDRDATSELFYRNHEVTAQILRAKRLHVPPDLDEAQRRSIAAGWRREVDRSAAVALLRALEDGRTDVLPGIRDLAGREGTPLGALSLNLLSRMPKPVALILLHTARRLRGVRR